MAAWMRVVGGWREVADGKKTQEVGSLVSRRSRCAGWGGGGGKSFILDSALPPEPGPLSLKGTRSAEKNHAHSP